MCQCGRWAPFISLGAGGEFQDDDQVRSIEWGVANRNVKQRVQATESQENHLLDASVFDLTIEHTDTETMVEEEDIRTEPTRRKLVLVSGRQQDDVGGDTSDDGEGEDFSEHEECEEKPV